MRFRFHLRVFAGISCRRHGVAHLAARSAWVTLLLWPLWAVSAASQPFGTQAPSPLHQAATSPLSDQGEAIADLDGDRHPDLAIVRPEGWSPRGFQYQVELDLTTHPPSSPISIVTQRGGLRIAARDVDGDGDLDLVVRNSWSLAPVGVWINDGHGRFTKGDPAAYPVSVWTEGPGILSDTLEQTLQAALPQSYRFYLDLSLPLYLHNDLTFEHPPLPSTGAQPFERAVTQPSTRAPPPSFPQHSI